MNTVIKLRLQLDAFEEKLVGSRTGEATWTDLDRRTYGALHNAYRLALHDLKPPPPSTYRKRHRAVSDLETYLRENPEPA